MAKIFITGSADGLGLLTAKLLISQGHEVVAHARNETRGRDTRIAAPGVKKVLIADLSSLEETKDLALAINNLGTFDAVIHNAGVFKIPMSDRGKEGLPLTFAINTLAPYILTCLIHKPKRLIYLGSDMHMHGDPTLKDMVGDLSRISYSDSKLHDVILAMAVARLWSDVYSNAVDPGWVPTKMGGRGAPDDLEKGFQTQAWLAVSDDEYAQQSGRYLHHKKEAYFFPAAGDPKIQDKFLKRCEEISGIKFP